MTGIVEHKGPSDGSAGAQRPPGSLAWREYQVELRSGLVTKMGFMLADPRHEVAAHIKRTYGASHLGLVMFSDPDSHSIVWWFQRMQLLTLITHHADAEICEEMKIILPRYFAAFFDDIKDIAPGLGGVTLVMPRTGDRRLH